MSDTPRTSLAFRNGGIPELLSEAKDLERELAAANRKIQRLVEIGDRLAMAAGENPYKGSLVTRWNDEWTAAKEEKAS